MKRMILLSFLVLSFPFIVYGQDRVEAPVWNVGDKWTLSDDVIITVVNVDQDGYTVKYTTPRWEASAICEKGSLNRIYYMDKDQRIKYEGRNKRLFNFPLDTGKTWKDQYMVKPIGLGSQEMTYLETFTVLGWEDVAVEAGKFKALKIEYKLETAGQGAGRPKEGKAWYWYSPEVKYMVKYQCDKSDYWETKSDWEVTSFKLKQ